MNIVKMFFPKLYNELNKTDETSQENIHAHVELKKTVKKARISIGESGAINIRKLREEIGEFE